MSQTQFASNVRAAPPSGLLCALLVAGSVLQAPRFSDGVGLGETSTLCKRPKVPARASELTVPVATLLPPRSMSLHRRPSLAAM